MPHSAGQRPNAPASPAAADVGVVIDAGRRKARAIVAATDVDRVIARLATAQGGVAGRAQLLALGVAHGAIDHRVRAGRLVVVFRGVYAVGHAALGELGRSHAALLAAGPSAVLSYLTAAAWWRVVPSMPARLEVTVTEGARRSREGLIVHATRRPPDVRTVGSLPVTAPLRTLVDLKATRPAADFARACNEALVLQLVTDRQLEAAGLVASGEAAPTRSRLEQRFRRVLRAAGLAQPRSNHPIPPYECDFVWPQQRVIVETDGWASHGNRFAFERDRARDADLMSRGWIVLRFTWRQVWHEPLLVVARLAPTLALRDGEALRAA